jgi:hypothetical protein
MIALVSVACCSRRTYSHHPLMMIAYRHAADTPPCDIRGGHVGAFVGLITYDDYLLTVFPSSVENVGNYMADLVSIVSACKRLAVTAF